MFGGYLMDKIALAKQLDDPIFNDLKHQGLHIFPHLISPDDVSILLDDFLKLKNSRLDACDGQLTGRIYSQGILTPLIGEYAKKIMPHAIRFLNTEQVKVEISYYQESQPQLDLECIPGGDFHVDDNKANLKYFIYLSDVELKNGPFSCVPATGSWRLKGSLIRGIFWELTGNRKYHYEYLIDRARCIANEKMIAGVAGTHFLVDTTSLHRAQPVVEGFRRVAVISFNRYEVA